MTVRVGLAAVLLGTAGCSSVPDAVNPAEWYRSASTWLGRDTGAGPARREDAAERAAPAPRPGEQSDTFPSLATVPERPTPTADPATRRETLAAMRRDAAGAQVRADALNVRAAEELGRREQPMTAAPLPALTPAGQTPPGEALPEQRSAAALARPPAEPASGIAPPASGADAAPGRAAGAGFTPGAPVAPRPPVMPPQPLSQQASGRSRGGPADPAGRRPSHRLPESISIPAGKQL